ERVRGVARAGQQRLGIGRQGRAREAAGVLAGDPLGPRAPTVRPRLVRACAPASGGLPPPSFFHASCSAVACFLSESSRRFAASARVHSFEAAIHASYQAWRSAAETVTRGSSSTVSGRLDDWPPTETVTL